MDAGVFACTVSRPSVVVKYDRLYSEMRNVRKSGDLLLTGEFTVTHLCFCRDSFQCTCMRIVARPLGTVCVCLTWSSLLPRYCCCVDCLYCDLGTGDSQDLKYGGFPYHSSTPSSLLSSPFLPTTTTTPHLEPPSPETSVPLPDPRQKNVPGLGQRHWPK